MAPPPTHRVALGLALLAVGGLAGCALPTAPAAHHILVHKEGDPIDGKKDKLTPGLFEAKYLKPIRDGIEDHVGTHPAPSPARVMLFVHGGLNTYEAGLERVNTLVKHGKLLETDYYPVFINWNSSLWSSLWDDFFIVRREQRAPFKATVTAPFVLLSRVAEAALSVPRSLWSFVEPEGRPEGTDGGEAPFDKGPSYLLLAPVRGLTVPFLDAFGAGAWDIMKRRAAFVTARGLPEEARAELKTQMVAAERRGAARTLLSSLLARLCVSRRAGPARLYWTAERGSPDESAPADCRDRTPGREVHLTLVGHSMGALVVNRLLLGFPEVPFRRVIFLGAAASIDEVDTVVLPFLDRHSEAEVHSVSLSMNDERYEKGWGDLWERGSLLVWIDNLFERVHSAQQLRLGRCLNLFRPAPGEPDSTRRRYGTRLVFHKLSGQGADDPRRHGEFDEEKKLPVVLAMVEKPDKDLLCAAP